MQIDAATRERVKRLAGVVPGLPEYDTVYGWCFRVPRKVGRFVRPLGAYAADEAVAGEGRWH